MVQDTSLTPACLASPHLRGDRGKHEPQHSLQKTTVEKASLKSVFFPSLAQEWLWVKEVHGEPYLFPWVLDQPFMRRKTQGWPARHWQAMLDPVSVHSWPVAHVALSPLAPSITCTQHGTKMSTGPAYRGLVSLPCPGKHLPHRDI